MGPMPNTLQSVHRFNGEVGKERAEKPKSCEDGNPGSLVGEVRAAHNHHPNQRYDHEEEKKNVRQPRPAAKPQTAPVRGYPPQGAVPETLREVYERAYAQADPDAQKQETPVHS